MGIGESKMPTPEKMAKIIRIDEARKERGKEKSGERSGGVQSTEQMSIETVSNFTELYETLKKSGGLQGTYDYFDSKTLISLIDSVRKGTREISAITRTGGLRDKISELLESENNIEKNLIKSIPEEKTKGVLILTKIGANETMSSSIKKGDGIAGKLMNPPIEIGKYIELALGNTSEVVSISKKAENYFIQTRSGSEYFLQKIDDNLKKSN